MGDIVLTFKGKEFRLPENRAFEAGEAIEEIAPLAEVTTWGKRPKFFKLARCFAELLRMCGEKVTDKEVHAEMMAGFKDGNPGGYLSAMMVLIEILMDGAPETKGEPSGKPEAAS